VDSISTTLNPSSAQRAHSQSGIGLFEQIYSAVCWLFFTNGVGTLLNDNELIMKLLRYSILLVALLLLIARWKGTLRALSKGAMLWPIVALMIFSYAWSMSPTYTLESIRGEVLPMTAFALYFASRFNIREQMRIIAITLAIGAALSLFYAMAIPSVGRHIGGEFDGAWRGIYAQKNNFSTTMTLTMLIFFILSLGNRNPTERLLSRLGLLFSVAMIILSTSKSGLIVFITLLIILIASRLFRWRGTRSVLILDLTGLTLLGLGAVLSVTWQAIVIGLGKDPTLSARTYIWAGSMEKISQQPILGYGRAAFWVPDSIPAWEVGALSSPGFIPSHAHNGFLDVALELGMVGLGLFTVGAIATFGMALRRAYKASEPEDWWPFAFLVLMLMSNMTESVLMIRTTIYWVLYMVLFLSLRLWPRRTGTFDF
jgi:exopolysaccharide production protein ExoQ